MVPPYSALFIYSKCICDDLCARKESLKLEEVGGDEGVMRDGCINKRPSLAGVELCLPHFNKLLILYLCSTYHSSNWIRPALQMISKRVARDVKHAKSRPPC